MNYTVEQVVSRYVALRDDKRQLEQTFEENKKIINEKLEKLEAWLLSRMNEDNIESFKTEAGTAYKCIKTSCSIADKKMYQDFIFRSLVDTLKNIYNIDISELLYEKPNWGLVDFRALKKGVETYVEDNDGEIPPGLNISKTTVVNVRSK